MFSKTPRISPILPTGQGPFFSFKNDVGFLGKKEKGRDFVSLPTEDCPCAKGYANHNTKTNLRKGSWSQRDRKELKAKKRKRRGGRVGKEHCQILIARPKYTSTCWKSDPNTTSAPTNSSRKDQQQLPPLAFWCARFVKMRADTSKNVDTDRQGEGMKEEKQGF